MMGKEFFNLIEREEFFNQRVPSCAGFLGGIILMGGCDDWF